MVFASMISALCYNNFRFNLCRGLIIILLINVQTWVQSQGENGRIMHIFQSNPNQLLNEILYQDKMYRNSQQQQYLALDIT